MADPDYSDVQAARRQWQQTHDLNTGDPLPPGQTNPPPATTAQPQPGQPRQAPPPPPAAPEDYPYQRAAGGTPGVRAGTAPGQAGSAGDYLWRQPLTGLLEDIGPPVGLAQSALHQLSESNARWPGDVQPVGMPPPPGAVPPPGAWTTPVGAEAATGAGSVTDPNVPWYTTFNRGAMRAAGAALPFAAGAAALAPFTGGTSLGAAGAVEGGGMLVGGTAALADRYLGPGYAAATTLLGTLAAGPEMLYARGASSPGFLRTMASTAARLMHPLGSVVDAGMWAVDRAAQLATTPRNWPRAAGVWSGGQAGAGGMPWADTGPINQNPNPLAIPPGGIASP